MADFAFRHDGPDSDVLKSRREAERLRDHLKSRGHDAKVERSGGLGREHRVWLQHPEHKDSVAYVSKDESGRDDFDPHWIRK